MDESPSPIPSPFLNEIKNKLDKKASPNKKLVKKKTVLIRKKPSLNVMA